jgi:hypothetical protein
MKREENWTALTVFDRAVRVWPCTESVAENVFAL